ncbi:MAG: PspC domain-containing protein [Flavobacteriaceae bacterium]|jgi:phage shock protein PspC (stress-responsive transcriptional regulator)|nr:PspC domain-containing protein [Flavobacteriaceae bacterium]
MKKTININLAGFVFYIDEDAYEELQKYLKNIKTYLGNTEGREEIIDDIESRIAELFSEKQKQVITLIEVSEVIEVMGQPEDYMSEDETEQKTSYKSSNKRLYRDPDSTVLGGVCSGIGHYLSIDAIWIRLIFLAMVWSGVSILFYFILWAIIPKAETTAQKLEMKGKAATFSNIEDYVRKGYENVKDDFKNVDFKGAGEKAKQGASGFFALLGELISKLFSALGKVLSFIANILGKLLGVIILTTTVALIIALTVSFIIGSFIDINIGNDLLSIPGFEFIRPDWGGPFHPIWYHISMMLTFGIPAFSLLLFALQLLFKNMGRLSGGIKIGLLAVWMISLISFIILSLTQF